MEKRYPQGWSAGYSEYRYGPERPVYDPAKPVTNRLSVSETNALAKRLTSLLDDYRANKWEREAETTYGLRRALLEKTSSFQYSDRKASAVVDRAYEMLGRGKATRPSFHEGQPGFTIPVEQCLYCTSKLSDAQIDAGYRFCSAECARHKIDLHKAQASLVLQPWARKAYDLTVKEKNEPRTCEQCKRKFRPVDAKSNQRFCSVQCKHMSQRTPPKNCEFCGEEFTPSRGSTRQKYCSHKHALEAKKTRTMRECALPECSKMFIPNHKNETEGGNRGLFCSRQCSDKYRSIPKHKKACLWCGTSFQAASKAAKFCCSAHNQAYRKAIKGELPKRLSAPAFDFCFAGDVAN